MKITIELNSIEELKEFEQHCSLPRIENMKANLKLNEKSETISRIDRESRDCKHQLIAAEAKIRGLEKEVNRLRGDKVPEEYAMQLNKEERKGKGIMLNE